MMPPQAQQAPATGPLRPKAVLLDVNQTLFPLEPLRQRFREVGLHGPQDLEVTTRKTQTVATNTVHLSVSCRPEASVEAYLCAPQPGSAAEARTVASTSC